ncbi:MAG: DUF2817 domain-containing protein [Arenicella sp.]|jgi:predicted deacylase|nr:DUF2817 domain-containing protein [Arenicella sp.]
MQDVASYFSESYAQARSRFVSACEEAGIEYKSSIHPLRGPAGEELVTDSAFIGAKDAKQLLVIISGVHGPELMTGSGCQVGFITESLFSDLPADTAVLMVHAANPWGAAHLRRNNEDNVDLCRNFIDFDHVPAHNDDYDNVKEWLPYAFSEGEQGDVARKAIENYKKEHGEGAFGRGFMAGQYHDAVGISYGGSQAVWSHQILQRTVESHGSNAENICVLDIHSGLGPYAYCTTVCLQVAEGLTRAKQAYGEWVLAPNDPAVVGDGKAPDVSGHTTELFERLYPNSNVTLVVMEFGVKSYEHTAEILMREHRLTQETSDDDADLQRARDDLLRAFYPKDKYWRRAVWNHSLQAVEQSLDLLAKN